MKPVLSTLYGKISLIFIALIFILGTAQILLSVRASMDFACESDQQLNRNLAANLAKRFQPLISDSLDIRAVEKMISELMVMNPSVEIYLLRQDGEIIAFFGEPDGIVRNRVSTEPVNKFLDADRNHPLPIMGDDPRSDSKRKIFSVAPLLLPSSAEGYLYVIIGSELYDSVISSLRGSYILSTMVLAILITLVFGALVGLILFFYLTKRLHKMTAVVHEFEKGAYKERIDVKSNDEVGRLAMAFNTMADRIENNLRQLKTTDELRREFIVNVSHDLRSPLTSMQGYLETIMIKDEHLSRPERRKYLDTMHHNISSLTGLVEQLFELSKLDSMETRPVIEAFSPGELVQDVVLKFQPQAEERNVSLITRIPVNLSLAEGDIAMIDRVLSNLIDNGLRYTQKNGQVCVELKSKGPFIRITVSDTGLGIPEEDLPHIFDRFYRVEKSRSRSSGGSGLGLAIVKKILDAHGSRIQVDSKVSSGTVFAFFLKKHP